MKYIGIGEFKKYLKEKDKKELENELLDLFRNFKHVKEYYSSKINPNSNIEMLEQYKKIIEKEFTLVGNRFSLKYKKCRDAIKDFQKVCNQKNLVAELMFYYAELGIEFTNDYGDIDEQFYNNIAGAFENALTYVFKNDLEENFKNKAYKLMVEGQDIGWGFSDYLLDTYYNYYQSDEEDDE